MPDQIKESDKSPERTQELFFDASCLKDTFFPSYDDEASYDLKESLWLHWGITNIDTEIWDPIQPNSTLYLICLLGECTKLITVNLVHRFQMYSDRRNCFPQCWSCLSQHKLSEFNTVETESSTGYFLSFSFSWTLKNCNFNLKPSFLRSHPSLQ